MDEIAELPEQEARDYLFLAPHTRFAGRWYVDALDSAFFLDFEEQIGRYRTVSPATLEAFLERADDLRYKVVFEEDPISILSAWEHLNDPPDFSLNSAMEGTINGFLPFQLQGFNYLRRPELKGGFAIWSTGTGKTALETGLIKQHLEIEDYDLGLVICKRNNKVDTQRKLLELGSIDYAYIFDGTPKLLQEIYENFLAAIEHGERLVGVTNYEKFRDEPEWFEQMIEDRRVVVFWDEMPTKLSNRKTLLYESVRDVLYDSGSIQINWDTHRAAEMRQYALTATPIENDPVGLLNQVRLIDPEVWPVIRNWEKKYVTGRDFFSKEPNKFDKLDLMGLEIEFMVHQVDKEDPDIAKLFPKVLEQKIYVDWSPQDRRVYDQLQKIAVDLKEAARAEADVKPLNPLQLIGILQMLCDAPSMVQRSGDKRADFEAVLAEIIDEEEAEIFSQFVSGSKAASILLEKLRAPLTDAHCNKLVELSDIINVKHPNEKIIVFSAFADYIFPVFEKAAKKWEIGYAIYRGNDRQRQDAKDSFREDSNIRVLFSSDAGSDSVDLPEASVTVEYDLPWKYTTRVQRRNRMNRVNATHEHQTSYTLLMPDSVEDRKEKIIERKKSYHDEILKGEIASESTSARMTAEDLEFILTGN